MLLSFIKELFLKKNTQKDKHQRVELFHLETPIDYRIEACLNQELKIIEVCMKTNFQIKSQNLD